MAFVKVRKRTKNGNGSSPSITVNKSGIGFNAPFCQLLNEAGAVCADLMYDTETQQIGFMLYTSRDDAPRDSYIIFGRGSKTGMGLNCVPFIRSQKFKTGTCYQVRWSASHKMYITVEGLELCNKE